MNIYIYIDEISLFNIYILIVLITDYMTHSLTVVYVENSFNTVKSVLFY